VGLLWRVVVCCGGGVCEVLGGGSLGGVVRVVWLDGWIVLGVVVLF